MKYTANYRFVTNVQLNGRLNVVACAEGDVIELDDTLAAEVLIQVPGALTPEAVEAPIEEPAEEPDVVTAPGPVDTAATRAVVATKKKAKP